VVFRATLECGKIGRSYFEDIDDSGQRFDHRTGSGIDLEAAGNSDFDLERPSSNTRRLDFLLCLLNQEVDVVVPQACSDEAAGTTSGVSKTARLERHQNGRPRPRSPDDRGAVAMQYMLAIYGEERAAESMPREQMTEVINAYMAYTQALRDAKVLVASNRLRPSSAATSLRTVGGETKVLDGPFAETKEQLGGYYLIDVPDLDAALSWAKRCPAVRYGTVEVRPVWVM
jgi:hypothetical protein